MGGFVFLAGGTAIVEIEEGVVDDLAVTRPELDGGNGFVRIDRDRNHEAAVDVTAAGRHTECLGDLEHQVRRAELPTLGEPGLWR